MYSILLTVHNKADIIQKILSGIIHNTTGEWELIVCMDGCTDGSWAIVSRVLMLSPIIKYTVFEAPDVFETKANNLCAMYASHKSKYLIFVQDDMLICEHGWNERLVKPMETWDDVFAVTARTAHHWRINPSGRDLLHPRPLDKVNDWCDILQHTTHADKTNTPRDQFAIRGSVNRGPLAVRADLFRALGGLDERFAPLQFDEHDLMFKARREGYYCGYYGIDWYSEPAWGGTRSADGSPKQFMYAADHKNSRLFFGFWEEWLRDPKFQEAHNRYLA